MLALAWALLALGGCTNLEPYRRMAGTGTSQACSLAPGPVPRPAYETSDGPCAASWAVRVPGSHGINYVEIDEQGLLNRREAMEDAIRYAGAPAKTPGGAYVVVYIHGWHHNAQAGDDNIDAFHAALAAVKQWHPDAEVRGIYIGWRGQSLPIWVLRYLTFWERKSTSDEVGRGGLLEFLLRLERAVKTPDAEGASNRLVLIGHSFGASVAFNALAHLYLERFMAGLHATQRGPRYRGYGDLVVLVNPAIEAMRFMPFESALRYYSQAARADVPQVDFQFEALPRLVILSSTGDWATRKTFPAARFISTALEQHNVVSESASPDTAAPSTYSEWVMDLQTVGNYDRFQTHSELRIAEDAPVADGGDTIVPLASGVVRQCRPLDRNRIRELLNQPEREAQPMPHEAFPDSAVRLYRKAQSIPNSPYVLADVDTRIVADHSRISSLNLICWINQLVDGQP